VLLNLSIEETCIVCCIHKTFSQVFPPISKVGQLAANYLKPEPEGNSTRVCLINKVRRKIVGAPQHSATPSHNYLFAASVNRGSFYNTSALHLIVMVRGILDALTIFRLSLLINNQTIIHRCVYNVLPIWRGFR
jgi:hypothetical protein